MLESEVGIWRLDFGDWRLEIGDWNLVFGIRNSKLQNPNSKLSLFLVLVLVLVLSLRIIPQLLLQCFGQLWQSRALYEETGELGKFLEDVMF